VSFDTIFSTIPSRTAEVIIYNRNSKALNISKISLSNGKKSVFRFNADGFAAPESNILENIVIGAKDSIFVMIETTLKENDTTIPIYITDNLVFTVNNTEQSLVLEAYGRDANILRGVSITTNTVFTTEKPYLIFDYLHIAAGATLTLNAGTELFLHKNTDIVVDGNIIATGTNSQPVTIRGDRFDLAYIDILYDYLPSQWGGIYIKSPSGENLLQNTIIRNGNLGIVVYGSSQINTKLKIENSVVHNMNTYGVLSQFGDVQIVNSEISNCGFSCIAQLGGKLKVAQSTIADYIPNSFIASLRKTPAVFIANYTTQDKTLVPCPINSSVIENSIIFGNCNTELVLQDTSTISFNVLISNCLVKAKKIERPELQNIIWSYSQNQTSGEVKYDTLFVNTSIDNIKTTGYFNFQLAVNSRAKDKANYAVAAQYPLDLLGRNRLFDSKPDLGAYERTGQ
jgi:parallel beta-helix repeat protein